MIHSTSLIILATTKIGEKSLVLHCLSSEWGRRSFITSVSKGSTMALYLPLNILDAEVIENPKSDLWRIRNISSARPLNGIRSNLNKNTMTLFMSEVLYRSIKDGANEEGLFDWCLKSIMTLDALESDFSNFHLRWLLELAGAMGFSPSAEDIAPFAGNHMGEISSLVSLGFSECLMMPLSGAGRNEIAEILLEYLGWHTESRIEVRSLKVLRELYR